MEILHTTSADGTRLRLGRWGSPGRNLLLIHGLAEHLGRYDHIAKSLAGAGWHVTAVELRGHGESEGRRGHVDMWIRYVEDIQAAAAVAGADKKPMVAVAHSMGGLALLDAMRAPIHPPVQAVALSNPLLGTTEDPPAWKLAAARVLSRLLPWLPTPNELDPGAISRDPEIVRRYQQDPLVYSTITPRWATEMMAAIARSLEHAPRYTRPLRMMVGTADRICDPGVAQRLAAQWGGAADLVLYEGFYHELFNEPEADRQRVLSELAAWLDDLELDG